MRHLKKIKIGIGLEVFIVIIFAVFCMIGNKQNQASPSISVNSEGFIKWIDFNVSYEALSKAYELDVASFESEHHHSWIELLAYIAAKNGGTFPKTAEKELCQLKDRLTEKKVTVEELAKDMKYYSYYLEAYEAILGGFVGEYEQQTSGDAEDAVYEKKYGLKVFSPIAKGFPYNDYDDFGSSRSYGYKREHLGHDMMGQVGTPIIAAESGYVEALGWNQYGGWRIGIRSFDKKRYYYYAHLRQNYPYNKSLEEGSIVTAGDVIGYMGHTGYSTKENVNNIETVHLHFGMQIIFDESQKDGNTELWIDCFNLAKFLQKHASEVVKVEGTKEWERTRAIRIPEVEENKKQNNSHYIVGD